MAASTPLSLSLQARDWETLVGIISQSADSDIQEIMFALSTYYRATTPKPNNTDVVIIATTEDLVIRLSEFLFGNTVVYVHKDVGTSTFNRIMTAIRLSNNVLDNYISTQLATRDANYAITATNIKKNGRRVIMMREYDSQ